jgi:anti-sigma factor RsiW
MNCRETKSKLEAVESGALSGPEARSVREHLVGCPACAAALGPRDRLETIMMFDEEIEPSPDFHQRFRKRLREHLENPVAASPVRAADPWWRRFTEWSLPRQAATAAAAAFVLALGIYVGVHRPAEQAAPSFSTEIPIAENLPLLEDMRVIQNLDLLEDFDAIKNLPGGAGSTVQ